MRLEAITYPKERKVHYTFGTVGGIDETISRITEINPDDGLGEPDDAKTFAAYQYDGSGRAMRITRTEVDDGLTLDYAPSGATAHAGLDRFGRVRRQRWKTDSVTLFDIRHGYDENSNRQCAERKQNVGHSEHYAYDDLNRLTDFKAGQPTYTSSVMDGVDANWTLRSKHWDLDDVGNHDEVDAFGQTDWYENTFNKANEFVGTGGSRKVRGTKPKPYALKDEFTDADTIGAYDVRDTTNDGFEIAGSYLKFTSVGQSTYDEEQEDEARAFVITGESIGSARLYAEINLPDGTVEGESAAADGNYAGIVFGYESENHYWMMVYELDSPKDRRVLYEVTDGSKVQKKSVDLTTDLTPGCLALSV